MIVIFFKKTFFYFFYFNICKNIKNNIHCKNIFTMTKLIFWVNLYLCFYFSLNIRIVK